VWEWQARQIEVLWANAGFLAGGLSAHSAERKPCVSSGDEEVRVGQREAGRIGVKV